MIALFSPTTTSAVIRGSSWLGLFCAIAVVVVHYIPPKLLIIAKSGPNPWTLLTRFHIFASLADWCEIAHDALPSFIKIAVDSTAGAFYQAVSSVIQPSAFVTWASLASVTVSFSSMYWFCRNKLISWKYLQDSPLPPGYLVFHALIITTVTTIALIVTFKYLHVYANILSAGVGPGHYIGCALFSGAVAAVYMAIAPLPGTMQSMEIAHIELLSVTSSVSAIVCMLVESLSK